MKIVTRMLLLLLVIFISGCATAPAAIDSRPAFSSQPQGNNGRLIVSAFDIPKNEAGVAVFHFLALLGGAKMVQVPFKTRLYDVTGKEPEYVGNIAWAPNAPDASGWLEYSLPAGERLLMLDRSGTYDPDFLTVNIKPGETTYVAISQYGYMSYAYLGEIAMEKQDYSFCTGLQKQGVRTGAEYWREYQQNYQNYKSTIDKYMADNRIATKANAFRGYCMTLALPVYVNVPGKTALDEFEASKPTVIALRDKNLEKWKSDPESKRVPFDLRHGDVKKQKACSNEVITCPDGSKVMRTENNCEFERCPS